MRSLYWLAWIDALDPYVGLRGQSTKNHCCTYWVKHVRQSIASYVEIHNKTRSMAPSRPKSFGWACEIWCMHYSVVVSNSVPLSTYNLWGWVFIQLYTVDGRIRIHRLIPWRALPGRLPSCWSPSWWWFHPRLRAFHIGAESYLLPLTHWDRDKMAAVSQKTLSNAFSWMKMLEFRLRFHWSLYLRVLLTIIQHWFR